MDLTRIEKLKEEYLKNGLRCLVREKDWTYLKTFTDNWDIEAVDFGTMIKNSIGAIKNFASQGPNPYSTIRDIGNAFPEFTRYQFEKLFDEKSGDIVTKRVKNFRDAIDSSNEIKKLLEVNGVKDSGKPYVNAQSNGYVVSYLWLRYPTKYYQYIPGKAKDAYEYLNPNKTLPGKGFDDKYIEISTFMYELKHILYSDENFYNKIKKVLDKYGYDIENTKVINHIVYWASQLQDKLKEKEIVINKINESIEDDNYDCDIFHEFNMKETLNIILYGPPGTGKTYETKRLAVKMCDGRVSSSYNEICDRYKKLVKDGRIQFITFHQSYSYEEFIGGLKAKTDKYGNITYGFEDGIFKSFCDKNRYREEKCVFIIDEINRGNIAKIFGELITLIETTKREGMKEATSAVLPYDKSIEFIVPGNINIIGTMNTADRSITQIDSALRRRFEFKEMMPDYDLLNRESENDEFNLKDLIEIMNQRIEVLYDRDHVIGHSYFMGLENNFKLKDLTEIFTNKIIPLLKEYFYDDYNKIQLVLGEFDPYNPNNFIRRVNNRKNLFSKYVDIDDIENYTYITNNHKNITLDTYKMILNDEANGDEDYNHLEDE